MKTPKQMPLPLKDEKPWKKSETDRMLDLHFAGCPWDLMAERMQRSEGMLRRRLQRLIDNYEGRAEAYEPIQRRSREGKPLSSNEKMFRDACVANKRFICTILFRPAHEVYPPEPKKEKPVEPASIPPWENQPPVPGEFLELVDTVRAHRYLYHVMKKTEISDSEYDALKKKAMLNKQWLGKFTPASKRVVDYPPYIRQLALYLSSRPGASGYVPGCDNTPS